MEQTTLTERLSHWDADLSIDAAERLVKNVALAGSASRNGYRYTSEALRGAVELYENKPVFLDHGPKSQPRDRSTRDLVGSIVSARFDGERLRGDIRVLGTESGETFLKLVESETPGVGMSHVVQAERSADGRTVDRIVDVISVDVVVSPATTTTFREQCRGGMESAPTAHALSESSPDVVADRTALLAEIARLKAELVSSTRRQQIESLLHESGLPASSLTPCFREQLHKSATLRECRELISDRLGLVRHGRAAAPVSLERKCDPIRPGDDEFLRAIRRR